MIIDQQSSSEKQTDTSMLKPPEEIRPPSPGEIFSELSRSDGGPPDSRTESSRELEERDEQMEALEKDDEDDGRRLQDSWGPEKGMQVFTPNVMIVQPTGHEDIQKEIQMEKIPLYVQNFHTNPPEHFHRPWIDDIDKPEGKQLI